ncbi:MAG: barstar family protein [Pseudomonadota bacterium]
MTNRQPDVTVDLDGRTMTSQDGFHKAFADGLGFPDFYGRNMDAWLDCMSCIDAPESGMSDVFIPSGGLLVIRIRNAEIMRKADPDLWKEMQECVEYANEELRKHGGSRIRIVKGPADNDDEPQNT